MVDHPEDRLALLAVPENRSGRYLSLEEMAELFDDFPASSWSRTYPGSVASMREPLAGTRAESGGDGWAIRFADGHMLKAKSEWYVTRHRH